MYDYLDPITGKTLTQRRENRKTQDREARLYQAMKQKLFIEDLQVELTKMENELRLKIQGKDLAEPTEKDKEEEVVRKAKRSAELEFQLRAKLADGHNEGTSSSSSSSEEEESKKKAGDCVSGLKKLDDYDYSSGIESDNDVDLLVE